MLLKDEHPLRYPGPYGNLVSERHKAGANGCDKNKLVGGRIAHHEVVQIRTYFAIAGYRLQTPCIRTTIEDHSSNLRSSICLGLLSRSMTVSSNSVSAHIEGQRRPQTCKCRTNLCLHFFSRHEYSKYCIRNLDPGEWSYANRSGRPSY